MTGTNEEGVSMSEFEESYDLPTPGIVETFTSDLLEETVEVLKPHKPICADLSDTVDRVLQGMAERNQGCVLVREGEVLVGIFTERDALRKVYGRIDPKKATMRDVMTRDPEAISFHDTIAVALNKMTVGGFRHVPLVDIQKRPVGVLSMKDIVNYFVEHFPAHVLNVPPDPTKRKPGEPAGAG
jgi:CBS domain-containing protein